MTTAKNTARAKLAPKGTLAKVGDVVRFRSRGEALRGVVKVVTEAKPFIIAGKDHGTKGGLTVHVEGGRTFPDVRTYRVEA